MTDMTTPNQEMTFSSIVAKMREVFLSLSDGRTGKNSHIKMCDAGLSAFSVFFMQSPSFLESQRTLQENIVNNNLQSLFGVFKIPCDNHIRNLLDTPSPKDLQPIFSFVFDGLKHAGVLDSYRHINNSKLVVLDGVKYFSSKKIHCPNCSTVTHKSGEVDYGHSAVTPVIVTPGESRVIPLMPEFVTPQDGREKQDCEINASKRWLTQWGDGLADLNVTILGDDLYCHEPFCRDVLAKNANFIFVCKPSSHKETYDWLEFLEKAHAVKTRIVKRWTGIRHEIDTYRYASCLPLREGEDALNVNWCELTTRTKTGEVVYHNSFATSHEINQRNVVMMVEAGRARWKIENENNNTLKTKGYNFEHNFGHGKKNLSTVLATMILLALLLHTFLEWMDKKYSLLRQVVPSRRRFFNDIRAITTYCCFDSWSELMDFMLQGWSKRIQNMLPT
jgi:hypothetical protein